MRSAWPSVWDRGQLGSADVVADVDADPAQRRVEDPGLVSGVVEQLPVGDYPVVILVMGEVRLVVITDEPLRTNQECAVGQGPAAADHGRPDDDVQV